MTSRNHVLSRAYRTAKDKMYKTMLDKWKIAEDAKNTANEAGRKAWKTAGEEFSAEGKAFKGPIALFCYCSATLPCSVMFCSSTSPVHLMDTDDYGGL